jgi:ATP-binding cassette subfamily C protein
MSKPMVAVHPGSIFVPLHSLAREFAEFGGAKCLKALLFVFLGAVLEGVGLALLIPFFSVIMDSQHSGGWVQGMSERLFALFSVESRLAKLSLLVALFSVLVIARAVIITVRDVTTARLQIGFIQQIRSRIAGRLAAARWDTVSRLRHSRVTHLMGADIQQLNTVTYILLRDAVAIVMLASQAVLAFLLAPVLAALALGIVLLGAATLLPMVRRARAMGILVTNANLSLINDMTQFLGALKLAISQNLRESFTREFEATLDNLRAQRIRYVQQSTATRLAVTALSGVVAAVAILLGIVVLDASPSILITLLLIISRMNGPAMQLQLDAQQIAQALPAYEKIHELEGELAVAEPAIASPAGAAIVLADGPIVFNKVSFLHDGARESEAAGGVRDLNLIIEPGSIVGVTGPSGAGKTTFADLLVGLYSPQSGEILIDSIALRGPSIMGWRNSVSYVPQDPFLFHDTIRRNLLWYNAQADEAAQWDMLRLAGAEEMVRDAAAGLDTVVGERGTLLSGGERQRLCLARAMLRRPHLLVLDEATSAIDVESERAIFERLLRGTPRPTIVMIAHRLESLRHCERVLHFEGGRLVSDGRK